VTDAWQQLAVLGTARGTVPPPAPHPLLEALFGALAWDDRESALLSAAALVAAARAAGATVLTGATTNVACEPDAAELPPSLASRRLRAMLGGEQPRCLREWLEVAAAAGRIVAPRDLPALLDRGSQQSELREAIGRVIGARGRWLARRDARWQWVAGEVEPGADAWETGSLAERRRWLVVTAARNPAGAATALMATWKDENGDSREALLAAVADRPHESLAEWLTTKVLVDRRAAIRDLARRALLRLPGSPFVSRAIERATPLVTVQGLLRKKLVVTMPAAFDPAWRADGIEEKPPEGQGPRAFWTRQLLALVPLDHWLAKFRIDAATFFAWNRDDESHEVLSLAVIDGQQLLPTPAGAVAFTKALLVGDRWPRLAPSRFDFVTAWLRELPADAAAAVFDELLDAPADDLATFVLLRSPRTPAMRDRTKLVHAIESALDRPQRSSPEAEQLAVAVPGELVDTTLARLVARPTLSSAAEAFVRTLEFRRACLTAFRDPTSP